jgi:hypothetical protein
LEARGYEAHPILEYLTACSWAANITQRDDSRLP